jgi:hypothetical protein
MKMDSEAAKAIEYAQKLLDAAIAVVEAARVEQLGGRGSQRVTVGGDRGERRGLSGDSRHLRRGQRR